MKKYAIYLIAVVSFVFCCSGNVFAYDGWTTSNSTGMKSVVKMSYTDALGITVNKAYTLYSDGSGWMSVLGPDSWGDYLVAVRNYQDSSNFVYTDTLGMGLTKGSATSISASWDTGCETYEPTSLSLENGRFTVPAGFVNGSYSETKMAKTSTGANAKVTVVIACNVQDNLLGYIYPAKITVMTSYSGLGYFAPYFTDYIRPFSWD